MDCTFPDFSIKKDAVYTLLTKRQCDEFENKCSALLTALLITIKDVIVCQMKDHNSGNKQKSCIPHDLGGERRFGFTDSYMTRASNATLEKVRV